MITLFNIVALYPWENFREFGRFWHRYEELLHFGARRSTKWMGLGSLPVYTILSPSLR